MAYDHENKEEMALGELSAKGLLLSHPLLREKDSMETVSGLYRTPAGVFLVVSQPVLTSKVDGPSHGRIVIGSSTRPPLNAWVPRRVSCYA